jgi:hypothetical protein
MKRRLLTTMAVTAALALMMAGLAQASSLVLVAELGCDDLAYKWYSSCDATKGMITASPDHALPKGGSWAFDFDGDPGFKSVMVGTSEQHTSFTADLAEGAVLTIVWSPGYSSVERLRVDFDGQTQYGRIITATAGDNGQADALLGAGDAGKPLWYFREVFTFGPLGDGAHNLTIWSLNGDGVGFDYIRLEDARLEVTIDIKPGSDPNCFNNDGHGVIPVAILGNATFDATEIDPGTVALEGLAVRAVGKSDKLLAHLEDVNADGFVDLVVQIQDADGTWTAGTSLANITGNLYDGTPIVGQDYVCITQ